jgi:hypothetical protein|nr:MAG TPA: hypothetical protein [Caudoviricetes sp.]
MIDEAMGLASMNPMVGTTPNNSVMLLHNIDDKDLSDGWDSYGLATTLDRDDAHITKDKNGKLVARPNKELEGKLVEVYICKYEKVQENFDTLYNLLDTPYSDRVLKESIYEMATGHISLTENFVKIDHLLEKVELKKISSIISSGAESMERELGQTDRLKNDGSYTPSNPDETAASGVSLLASADYTFAESFGPDDKQLENKKAIIETLMYDIKKDLNNGNY